MLGNMHSKETLLEILLGWTGELASSIRENGFNKGFTFVPQFFLCSMSLGRERDLSTGYESNRRRIDRIPFSGNPIDFPKCDYQFRIFASQLGCGPLPRRKKVVFLTIRK